MFPEYARTRTFTRLDNPRVATKPIWDKETYTPPRTCQEALDQGGCTVDEFFDKLNALIDQWPDA
jgi:hypothetical protein